MDLAQSRQPFVIEDDDGSNSGDYEAPKAACSTSSHQKKRDSINHILRLIKRHATHYEILGILPNATTSQIESAYRKVALNIHPDRNNDKDANRCTQGIYSLLVYLTPAIYEVYTHILTSRTQCC